MLKASALYIVISSALVIGILCSSLIVAAYFYRNEYQKKFRYDRLQNNINSGVNILLATPDTAYSNGNTFSLYNDDEDSVSLKKIFWGIYDVGSSIAFAQKDTLYKTFSIGYNLDSAKWAALYLIDEDRPLSLSGKTSIIGDVYIPKAGVTTSYMDNKAYQGDQRLIIGAKKISKKTLPPLLAARLIQFHQFSQQTHNGDTSVSRKDSVVQSFLLPTKYVNFKKEAQNISNIKLIGNLILTSDTTITLDSTVIVKDIIVFAKSIKVKTGFHGNCQLFARDSISIDSNCRFAYPSCLGILRFGQPGLVPSQEQIFLGSKCSFAGIIFTYEKTESILKPTIALGRSVKIIGQVYSQGILTNIDTVEVDGSVFTSQFLYKSSNTLYKNYLVNLKLNAKGLSPYYLTGDLCPVAGQKKKVLQWLEAN